MKSIFYATILVCSSFSVVAQQSFSECMSEVVLQEFMAIDTLDDDTFIITYVGEAKGPGSVGAFLIERTRSGGCKATLLNSGHMVSFSNVGRYYKAPNGAIYRIRREKKKGTYQLFKDQLVGNTFTEPDQPFFELGLDIDTLGFDYFFSDRYLYIEHSAKLDARQSVVRFDLPEFNNPERFVLSAGPIAKDSRLFSFGDTKGDRFARVHFIKGDGEQFQIISQECTNDGVVEVSMEVYVGFPVQSVFNARWVGDRLLVWSTDTDFNIHVFYLNDQDGTYSLDKESEIIVPVEDVLKDYAKNREGVIPVSSWKTYTNHMEWRNRYYSDNGADYIVSYIVRPGADGWYLYADCIVTKLVDGKIAWVTNIAREWHTANKIKVQGFVKNEKISIPNIRFEGGDMIMEDWVSSSCINDAGEYEKPEVTGISRKLFNLTVTIDTETGKYERVIGGKFEW